MRKYLFTILMLALFSGSIFADNLSVETVQMTAGSSKEVSISLNNSKQYAAFQFDIVLPEGVSVASGNVDGLAVSLTDRKANHDLHAAKVADNTFRLLAYSMDNATISGTEGALINVTLSAAANLTAGDKTAKIGSVVFVEADGNQAQLDDASFAIQVSGVVETTAEFKFKAAGKSGDYYYATYHASVASWFPADKFEMFTAVIEGSNVNMKEAEVLDGYYKINVGDNVVLRSKDISGEYETKALDNTNTSIEKLQNDLRYCVKDGDVKGTKINYIYKLGVKNSVVAFYRISSGEFKAGQLYIKAELSTKDRLDITIDGVDINATSIFGVESATEGANAPIYNLKGMRVEKAQKGINIQNGKKYVKH